MRVTRRSAPGEAPTPTAPGRRDPARWDLPTRLRARRSARAAAVQVREARGLVEARRWKQAAAAYERALALHSANPVWHFELGRVLERRGRHADAARCYAAALERGDGRALWHARLGRVLEAQREWHEAALAYRQAVAREPGRSDWWVRLGTVLLRQGRWADAEGAFDQALLRDDGLAEAHYGRGSALDRQRRASAATAAYTAGLDRDPTATEVDRLMLAEQPDRFPARRQLREFVREHLPELRAAAERDAALVVPGPPRVFAYWAQGWEVAPAVVRRCKEDLLAAHEPGRVVLLDDACLPYWIALPERVRTHIGANRTALSDVVRLELLHRYGGVWVDATCLVTADLVDGLPSVSASGLFAYRWSANRLSNWLVSAQAGGHVVGLWRAALLAYWEHHDEVVDYYVTHHLFEALCHLDEEFRAAWDAAPQADTRTAHRLQWAMREPWDAARLQSLLDAAPVHKLTYKGRSKGVSPDSLLAGLVQRRDRPPSTAVPGPGR